MKVTFFRFAHFATNTCKISISNIFWLVGHFKTNNNFSWLFLRQTLGFRIKIQKSVKKLEFFGHFASSLSKLKEIFFEILVSEYSE